MYSLNNLIRISSICNNKKYPTIKKIFEAGDFYAILSDIVEKISLNPNETLSYSNSKFVFDHGPYSNLFSLNIKTETRDVLFSGFPTAN